MFFVFLFIYLFIWSTIKCLSIFGEPGEVSQGGRKGVMKVFKHMAAWVEDPLGTNSHQTISKGSSKCWLLIGHKKMKRTTYTMAIVLPYLSSLFTKVVRVHAWETFVLIIINPVHFKMLLKNQKLKHVKCMYGYFKDAFPKYQLELTTRI